MTWTVYDPQGAVRAAGDVQHDVLAQVAPRDPAAKGRNHDWTKLRRKGWRLVHTATPPARVHGTAEDFQAVVAQEKAARVAKVLEAAIQEARDVGYQWITRNAVGERAGVSSASVSNAFGGMIALKRKVMSEAVRRPIPLIVAQGLADGSPIARAAPNAVKEAARATLAG